MRMKTTMKMLITKLSSMVQAALTMLVLIMTMMPKLVRPARFTAAMAMIVLVMRMVMPVVTTPITRKMTMTIKKMRMVLIKTMQKMMTLNIILLIAIMAMTVIPS